jgi:hypothetical protein
MSELQAGFDLPRQCLVGLRKSHGNGKDSRLAGVDPQVRAAFGVRHGRRRSMDHAFKEAHVTSSNRSVLGRRGIAAVGITAALVAALLVVAAMAAAAAKAAVSPAFNKHGNVLISDQYNNRVIEVTPAGKIVWTFGDGSAVAGPHSVVGVNDAERISGGRTLIAGTGVPAGAPSPEPPGGAADNRVFIVNSAGHIVWQFGKAGVTGSGPNQLNTPVQATFIPGGDVLITDQGNQRVILVDKHRNIIWQYGKTGVAGSGFDRLNNPNSAELLPNGHVLISDENNNRVLEVTKSKHVVWSYGSPKSSLLSGAAFASRLSNGDTLITDSNHSRIVEVSMSKHVVWAFRTDKRAGSVASPLPTRAVRLRNGDTLISDQNNDQVILVNHDKKIVRHFGTIAMPGTMHGLLNGPYDAKVIGDYPGLTRP